MNFDFDNMPSTDSDFSSDFEKLPAGKYNVTIDEVKEKQSASGKDMVIVTFTVFTGEYANRKIWLTFFVGNEYGAQDASRVAYASGKIQAVKSARSFAGMVGGKLELGIKYSPSKTGGDDFTNLSSAAPLKADVPAPSQGQSQAAPSNEAPF